MLQRDIERESDRETATQGSTEQEVETARAITRKNISKFQQIKIDYFSAKRERWIEIHREG